MIARREIEKHPWLHREIETFAEMSLAHRPMPRSAQLDIPVDVFEGGTLFLFKDATAMRLTAAPVPRAVWRQGKVK